ncbi:hypothetical protein HDU97_001027 [Phlyctochytrium planicorne]|nr:hypothetical protein HDU97_001027 [Phlyctochytrium planicorne]
MENHIIFSNTIKATTSNHDLMDHLLKHQKRTDRSSSGSSNPSLPPTQRRQRSRCLNDGAGSEAACRISGTVARQNRRIERRNNRFSSPTAIAKPFGLSFKRLSVAITVSVLALCQDSALAQSRLDYSPSNTWAVGDSVDFDLFIPPNTQTTRFTIFSTFTITSLTNAENSKAGAFTLDICPDGNNTVFDDERGHLSTCTFKIPATFPAGTYFAEAMWRDCSSVSIDLEDPCTTHPTRGAVATLTKPTNAQPKRLMGPSQTLPMMNEVTQPARPNVPAINTVPSPSVKPKNLQDPASPASPSPTSRLAADPPSSSTPSKSETVSNNAEQGSTTTGFGGYLRRVKNEPKLLAAVLGGSLFIILTIAFLIWYFVAGRHQKGSGGRRFRSRRSVDNIFSSNAARKPHPRGLFRGYRRRGSDEQEPSLAEEGSRSSSPRPSMSRIRDASPAASSTYIFPNPNGGSDRAVAMQMAQNLGSVTTPAIILTRTLSRRASEADVTPKYQRLPGSPSPTPGVMQLYGRRGSEDSARADPSRFPQQPPPSRPGSPAFQSRPGSPAFQPRPGSPALKTGLLAQGAMRRASEDAETFRARSQSPAPDPYRSRSQSPVAVSPGVIDAMVRRASEDLPYRPIEQQPRFDVNKNAPSGRSRSIDEPVRFYDLDNFPQSKPYDKDPFQLRSAPTPSSSTRRESDDYSDLYSNPRDSVASSLGIRDSRYDSIGSNFPNILKKSTIVSRMDTEGPGIRRSSSRFDRTRQRASSMGDLHGRPEYIPTVGGDRSKIPWDSVLSSVSDLTDDPSSARSRTRF